MKKIMKNTISNTIIGKRIAKLRKQKGLSQSDLAKSIKISRPSMTQMELGNRSIDTQELLKLSSILEFSLDEITSVDYTSDLTHHNTDKHEKKNPTERISIPKLNIDKFKNVILYILGRCAGKPNVGETVLNKLLYFSDFNYYELYEEHLTGANYKKLPYGPVPQNLTAVLSQLIDDKQIKRIKTEYHNLHQTRFLPLAEADLTKLKASEVEVINNVIDQMGDWNANMISEYSHKDMPWLATKDKEIIDYELVFYRELPFSVRTYASEIQ